MPQIDKSVKLYNHGEGPCLNSVLNVKAVVAAFNQEKALVGAFSVIVKLVVEPMDRFTALVIIYPGIDAAISG